MLGEGALLDLLTQVKVRELPSRYHHATAVTIARLRSRRNAGAGEEAGHMPEPEGKPPVEGDGRVPFMQRLMDNPFLLLFLGILVPTVFYLLWGIMEIVQIPVAP